MSHRRCPIASAAAETFHKSIANIQEIQVAITVEVAYHKAANVGVAVHLHGPGKCSVSLTGEKGCSIDK